MWGVITHSDTHQLILALKCIKGLLNMRYEVKYITVATRNNRTSKINRILYTTYK